MAEGGEGRWQLQEAESKLSVVIDQAILQGPQVIARQGKDAAVVLSYADYQTLLRPRDSLAAFFQRSPLAGLELDLARPTDTGREIEL